MVGINVAIPVPVAAYAVQGWKDSAYGDTGLNNASWSFYTRPKYVTSRWDSVAGTDFGSARTDRRDSAPERAAAVGAPPAPVVPPGDPNRPCTPPAGQLVSKGHRSNRPRR